MKEKWILINKKTDFRTMAETLRIDPLTARILANRGVDTAQKAAFYLKGTLKDLPDPALLKDAAMAADLLVLALKSGRSVAVASDYDVDGLFAGQILKESLSALGFAVKVFTPNRIEEGYGLNRRIVDEAEAFGAGVLITCDNGIASLDEVAYAKELGLSVIVTDHHEPQEGGIPAADAVIDPKRADCDYPFDGICGAVVALKLMQLLYRRLGRDENALLEKMLPYAAIATVADVMDLTEENRVIVRLGLKALSRTENEGLQALIRQQGLDGRPVTAYHIGFVIGPCFNAAGRLETVEPARRLLEAKGEEAEALAGELIALNQERQKLTNEGLARAEAVLTEEIRTQGAPDKILVVHLPEVHESVAGIVAGRLKEKYHRPALVITGVGEACKGSGRSLEIYNLFEHLEACADLLLRFGGHAMAAGFSLKEENIAPLRERLNRLCGLAEEDLIPVVELDAAMPPEYATVERIKEWDALAPFGKGFARPLFGRSGLELQSIRVLGMRRNALRLRFAGESGQSFEGIWFGDVTVWEEFLRENYGERAFTMLERGQTKLKIALAYQPMLHEYEGRRSVQFQILHFQPASGEG
ncbi:MAG: single-stranded-DNA-specific exonuclease RecJ [Lachnospiraceae bacterium]|nr:single-stranded-DNA-specific exonuclease RecJ [Lachnospiraceae bacterium]